MAKKSLVLNNRIMKHPSSCCYPILFVALFLAGCGGPEIVEVTGKVTYNDEPLTSGTVMFQPVGGEHSQPATGTIQPDGTFKLTTREAGEGATVGENQVLIRSTESADQSGGGESTVGKSLIPSKYTRYGTSGITVNVQPGMEPVELKLNDER
jgi:hypothetical protein